MLKNCDLGGSPGVRCNQFRFPGGPPAELQSAYFPINISLRTGAKLAVAKPETGYLLE